MHPFRLSPITRLRPTGPGFEPARSRRNEPHSPYKRDEVRALVETTRLTLREIGDRAGVDNGTVSRWAEAGAWLRPPGANRLTGPRVLLVPIGRALATQLRAQAERLVREIEAAPRVDRKALAEALALLAEARAEQAIRRGTRRQKIPSPHLLEPGEAYLRRRKTGRRVTRPSTHDRVAAAAKGWSKRYEKMRELGWK